MTRCVLSRSRYGSQERVSHFVRLTKNVTSCQEAAKAVLQMNLRWEEYDSVRVEPEEVLQGIKLE